MTQEKAIQLAIAGHNIFLTGNAGTGKTYTLNNIIRELKRKGKIVAVTASTGIASTHINGSTIHSWSSIGIRDKLSEEDFWKIRNNKFSHDRINSADVLVIDEISMLHDYRFDLVNDVCKFVCGNRNKPFAGKQIIVVGDFFQLPPVNKNSNVKNYCFNANAWKEANFKVCYLKKIYRQENDTVLIDLLNSIRRNDIRDNHHEVLQSLDSNNKNDNVSTKLFCKNENVDILNATELTKIKSEAFISRIEGSGIDFKVEQLRKNILAPETLILKKGARVMFLVNDFPRNVVNGTLGEIIDLSDAKDGVIKMKVYKTGKVIDVTKHTWKMEEYSDREGRDITVASVSQFPLKLAWALTIHKSQGATFDYVNLDLRDTFVENMGYVALSRVTTLDGLHLVGYNNVALHIDERIIEKDIEFLEESERNE